MPYTSTVMMEVTPNDVTLTGTSSVAGSQPWSLAQNRKRTVGECISLNFALGLHLRILLLLAGYFSQDGGRKYGTTCQGDGTNQY